MVMGKRFRNAIERNRTGYGVRKNGNGTVTVTEQKRYRQRTEILINKHSYFWPTPFFNRLKLIPTSVKLQKGDIFIFKTKNVHAILPNPYMVKL